MCFMWTALDLENLNQGFDNIESGLIYQNIIAFKCNMF